MMFWDLSEKGRPHKRAGNLLIRPYHPVKKDEWDSIFITKRFSMAVVGIKKKPGKALMSEIRKGMRINIGDDWEFTKEERELVVEVNKWLKKHIKGDILTREEIR